MAIKKICGTCACSEDFGDLRLCLNAQSEYYTDNMRYKDTCGKWKAKQAAENQSKEGDAK